MSVTWDILVDVAACLCDAVAKAEMDDLCFCGILPGTAVAADYINGGCEDSDGMGWVRLVNLVPTQKFPQPLVVADAACASINAIGIEVGILRSMPSGTSDGEPPDAADMQAAAERQVLEAELMKTVIACCYGNGALLGTYAPLGPAGGAIGGYWQFSAPSDGGGF